MPESSSRPWPADEPERRSVDSLVPYARNARTHTPAQVDRIAASVREWGWTTPVLVDEEGGIIAGHCRVMAAKKLGLAEVPCIVARGWSEAQKRAYVLADNQLAIYGSDWDTELLNVEIGDLVAMDYDLGLAGFDESELRRINALSSDALSEKYVQRITPPVYEPRGDKPPLRDLFDRTKTDELEAEIEAANLPADVATFLRLAAQRHTVFRYGRIAEYYCHAPAEVQKLFERSALVVIDYQAAVEGGFVRLTKRLGGLADKDAALVVDEEPDAVA